MTDTHAAAVRTEGLTKSFRGQVAVDRLSLSVPEGAVFGLLGENGAGKTTALRMLLGLTEPDAGQVEVLGIDPVRSGREVRSRVGYVPEQPCLYDWMTVDEIGWFAAGFYPNGFRDHYRQAVNLFELEPRKKIKELSKGMRAQVSLALALAADPPLLILDEPTSGLDLMVRRDFLESTVDLAAQGRTVLLSSHQVAEVERVADWIGILRHGRLLVCAPLEQLKGQVQELTLTLADAAAATLIGVDVLYQTGSERQRRMVVRGLAPEELERLRKHEAIHEAALRSLSLEEIFVAYVQSAGS